MEKGLDEDKLGLRNIRGCRKKCKIICRDW
jgi:hypothetical protein